MGGEPLGFWGAIIGAIVGALLTGVIAVIGFYIKGRRGNTVVVQRVSETPQIEFPENIDDAFEILYKGEKIDNLVLNNLNVGNRGRKVISPVEFDLYMTPAEGKIEFLRLSLLDHLGISQTTGITENPVDPIWKFCHFTRPYLNHINAYPDDFVELTIFSNTKLQFYVKGGGKDWGVQYEDIASVKADVRKFYRVTLSIILGAGLLIAILILLEQMFNLDLGGFVVFIGATASGMLFGITISFGLYIMRRYR